MKAFACLALCLTAAAPAAPRLTDAQIRQRMIEQSIARYPGPGPCPYSVMRNGRTAGQMSRYSRPWSTTYRLKCFPADISDAEVRDWRRAHSERPPGTPSVEPAW